jgi:ubiquinone/menaquinone biosynthesis C-methylase UbiE
MTKTDYDDLAPDYDRRYAMHRYDGIGATLGAFVSAGQRVLEVGCGTGHWLAELEAAGCTVAGLEPAAGMLERARARGLRAELSQGRAEALPYPDGVFDRVLCVNAIHHFDDVPRFLAEARRVLRARGRVLSIALDPSIGRDRWSIYDYFAPTRALDLARYPTTSALRDQLAAAGFVDCRTDVAQHTLQAVPAREALERDLLAKHVTSQLAILTDEQYQTGLDRIREDAALAEARGETLRLIIDLQLYATSGAVP